MTAQQDDPSFKALTQKISRTRGIGCESYKEKCLKRRIAVEEVPRDFDARECRTSSGLAAAQ